LPVVFVVHRIVGWAGMAAYRARQVLLAAASSTVQAARALALGRADVIGNVIAPVIVAATLGIGGAIMAEAALSFIGSATAAHASWGAMVAEGRDSCASAVGLDRAWRRHRSRRARSQLLGDGERRWMCAAWSDG